MDGRAGERTDWQADGQTGRQTAGGWTDGPAGWRTDGQVDGRRAGGRLADGWWAGGLTDGRTVDGQAGGRAGGLTDWPR